MISVWSVCAQIFWMLQYYYVSETPLVKKIRYVVLSGEKPVERLFMFSNLIACNTESILIILAGR